MRALWGQNEVVAKQGVAEDPENKDVNMEVPQERTEALGEGGRSGNATLPHFPGAFHCRDLFLGVLRKSRFIWQCKTLF